MARVRTTTRPHRPEVRTRPFQGRDSGSIPDGDAKLDSARSTGSKYLKSSAVTAVRLNRTPSNAIPSGKNGFLQPLTVVERLNPEVRRATGERAQEPRPQMSSRKKKVLIGLGLGMAAGVGLVAVKCGGSSERSDCHRAGFLPSAADRSRSPEPRQLSAGGSGASRRPPQRLDLPQPPVQLVPTGENAAAISPASLTQRPRPFGDVPTRRTSPGCTASIAWINSGTTGSRSTIRFDAAPMIAIPKERAASLCWCSMLPSIVTKTSHIRRRRASGARRSSCPPTRAPEGWTRRGQ